MLSVFFLKWRKGIKHFNSGNIFSCFFTKYFTFFSCLPLFLSISFFYLHVPCLLAYYLYGILSISANFILQSKEDSIIIRIFTKNYFYPIIFAKKIKFSAINVISRHKNGYRIRLSPQRLPNY